MADYDPFARGSHPVGVRTFDVSVADRRVPVEVWYPAAATHAGQDLEPATQDAYSLIPGMPGSTQEAIRDAEPAGGPFTPVVFSHGFAGHRRQTTHLCTHLASHGYVVAAPDHTGNTTVDVMSWMLGAGAPPEGFDAYVNASATHRPLDASRALDGLVSGEFGVAARDDGAGMTGHSFGGWTTLQTTADDERILAALPLAPAGGGGDHLASPELDPRVTMRDRLELEWGREVPTLMIVADEDSVLPFPGMEDLLARSAHIDRMVVIVNADHYHFCDGAELVHDMMIPNTAEGGRPSSDYIPGAHAYQVTNAMGLAHFDATLRGNTAAAEWLEQDMDDLFGERGIVVEDVAG